MPARKKTKPRSSTRPSRPARRRFWWARLEDAELLTLRFCDLRLDLERAPLGTALRRIHGDLGHRGLRFRPHFWLSEDWFSPDGIPGVAIPFYLAHPRLLRLERRMMHEVEGGNERWLRRILRHEVGHAIDSAYRLRRRKGWRQVFGPASQPYPTTYEPRVMSRRYVMHLGHWYAQSHPTEDFAETFAVWLRRNSTWRSDYRHWPALKKLLYVDGLMREISDQPALVRDRTRVEPLGSNRRTLGEHYREKLRYYDTSETSRYDAPLRRVFAPRQAHPRRPPAAAFIRQARPQLQRLLVRRSQLHPYLVQHVMQLVTRRARELDLCVHKPLRDSKRATLRLMERILFDFIRRGRERYAL